MLRRIVMTLAMGIAFFALAETRKLMAQQNAPVPQQNANTAVYGQYGSLNMERFYHYPYVTYPHNYWGREYFRSNGSMYHRYPAEMRIPVYRRGVANLHSRHRSTTLNYYPSARRYHWGHQFILDVF